MENPVDLYLTLLKKVLSFHFWPEPPETVEKANYRRSKQKARLVSWISKLLKYRNFGLVKYNDVSADAKEYGMFWPGLADTMIGLKRLDNIQYCVEKVLEDGVPGDLIETGVWRGGASIFMQGVLVAHGATERRVFVADSFRGLPKPDARYPQDAGDLHHTQEPLAISRSQVESNFNKYGLLKDNVCFLEGWFEETLPGAPIDCLSVLRLDGDMYSSTIQVLETLYPKLSSGGFCIIDDYALKGCQAAVDDFRSKMKIQVPLQKIDWTGVYWRKA